MPSTPEALLYGREIVVWITRAITCFSENYITACLNMHRDCLRADKATVDFVCDQYACHQLRKAGNRCLL